jgi:hypothetical protein
VLGSLSVALVLAGCRAGLHEHAQLGSYGAVAYDDRSGRQGVSWDQPTEERAALSALSQCGTSACKVVMRVPAKRCGALATTADGKGWGVAGRATMDQSRIAALANCAKTKLGDCVLRVSDCNK